MKMLLPVLASLASIAALVAGATLQQLTVAVLLAALLCLRRGTRP